jgi:hypothetical protein
MFYIYINKIAVLNEPPRPEERGGSFFLHDFYILFSIKAKNHAAYAGRVLWVQDRRSFYEK